MNVELNNNLTWYGEIPSDWEELRIKDVACISPNYSQDKPSDFEECTIVPMEAVSTIGHFNLENKSLYIDVSDGLPNFEAGDVLFAKITPCMENGKGGFVDSLPTRYGFGSTEFHVLRPSSKVDGKFLYYYTFNPTYRKYAEANMTGAAGQKRVSSNFLKFTKVFLPHIDEQRLIGNYLEKNCSAIDKAISFKFDQLEKLEDLRQSIIFKAMVKGLDEDIPMRSSDIPWFGDIPEHWEVESLKRLLIEPLKYGANEAAELTDPDLPRYIRITDFDNSGKLKDHTFKSLANDKAEGYYIEEGDILFARSGATVGKTFLFSNYNGKACFAGYLIRARCNTAKILPEFLYLFTKSKGYTDWKDSAFTQATIQNIGADKYSYLPIVQPPIGEQKKIIEFVNRETARIESIEEKLKNQISVLREYKHSLIHECVTAKRRVTEADLTMS
ncbi:restriction endonuclease subunit S [Planctobacterium marinum]|uniref:Type I restriction modification DNA specificity domain-containing protein n=1 Tax=Planctobacterium marinum TaxID=1631968 RepID=A0AA48HE30_9ALTE|nr:hypothetical protein MACH26_01470 [Planctobacterium marinum]